MLTHLIILLDDTSVSYCHCAPSKVTKRLISIDYMKAGIVWAMKENLNIQFVYPSYELPSEYLETIDSIDHTDIKPVAICDGADVVVLSGWDDEVPEGATCIIHSSFEELSIHVATVNDWLRRISRLNVVLTDVDKFKDGDIDSYNKTLESLVDGIVEMFQQGRSTQLNMLTDRLMLTEMNNCGAGDSNVTLAPNGKFYLCPAFYYEDEKKNVGDLKSGLHIKNPQLLRLDHAPVCRQCDAYQCRRCIWMNQQLTMDANTPSHQQCVVAHLERNASRYLQIKLNEAGIRLTGSQPIEEMTELDPFNIVNRWK